MLKKAERPFIDIRIFLVHSYVQTWFNIPLAISTRFKDLQFLQKMFKYSIFHIFVK